MKKYNIEQKGIYFFNCNIQQLTQQNHHRIPNQNRTKYCDLLFFNSKDVFYSNKSIYLCTRI